MGSINHIQWPQSGHIAGRHSAQGHVYNRQDSGVVLINVCTCHEFANKWLWPMLPAMLERILKTTVGQIVHITGA